MGTIDIGMTVAVNGRVGENSWFQIDYRSGPDGHGWVSGDLIHVNAALAGLPFYNLLATPISDEQAKGGGDAPTADPNATAAPTPTQKPTPARPTGEVYDASQLEVHSGPASSLALLTTLKSGAAVVLTGE